MQDSGWRWSTRPNLVIRVRSSPCHLKASLPRLTPNEGLRMKPMVALMMATVVLSLPARADSTDQKEKPKQQTQNPSPRVVVPPQPQRQPALQPTSSSRMTRTAPTFIPQPTPRANPAPQLKANPNPGVPQQPPPPHQWTQGETVMPPGPGSLPYPTNLNSTAAIGQAAAATIINVGGSLSVAPNRQQSSLQKTNQPVTYQPPAQHSPQKAKQPAVYQPPAQQEDKSKPQGH